MDFLKHLILLKIGSLLLCNKKCQQYPMSTFIVFERAYGGLSLTQQKSIGRYWHADTSALRVGPKTKFSNF